MMMAFVAQVMKQTLLTIVYPDRHTHAPFALRILLVPQEFEMQTPPTLPYPAEQTH